MLTTYEIKILNSKKYDEQLNLIKFSIKNKIFEITKGCICQQNLRIELLKMMKFLKTKYLPTHGLIHKKLNLMT